MTGEELYCKLTGHEAEQYPAWHELTDGEREFFICMARKLAHKLRVI